MHHLKGEAVMKYALAASIFLIAISLGVFARRLLDAEAVNPPSQFQTNSDIYACCGLPSVFSGTTAGDLSSLNPITNKLRAGGRTVTFSYQVVSGCNDGNMYSTLRTALDSTSRVEGVTFVQVTSNADVSVRATCGVDAANAGITGSVIADLYPSWPYVSTINATTTMATFYDLSQVAIWEHEFAGHAMLTWNEQYQLNGSFGSTPGLVDFMNTGPDSRYDWPQNDIDRVERTAPGLIAPAQDCSPLPPNADGLWFYPCEGKFYNAQLWSFDPASGAWADQKGVMQFAACNADRLRWSPTQGRWELPGQDIGFDPALGLYVIVPAC